MENDLANIGRNSAHLPVRPGYARRGGTWGGVGDVGGGAAQDCTVRQTASPPPYSQKGGHKNGQ